MITIKTRTIAACIAASSFIPTVQAQSNTSQPYTALTLGKVSGEEGGTSGAVGFYGPRFGFEIGMVGNSEFDEGEALDYPVPHSDFRSLGTKRVGNTWGIDTLFFLGGNTWRPFIGAGVYFSETAEIAKSNVTGWLYTESSKSKTELAGSVGMHYASNSIVIGVVYHTVRGPGATLGLRF